MWIDNRSVNINGASNSTNLKADEVLKVTGASRDKIRDAFDALLHQIEEEEMIEVVDIEESEDEG